MSKNNWTAESIPSQEGKIVVITGSNTGLGYETARVLANKGANVIMAVRNFDKGTESAGKIKKDNPKANVEVMVLDLSSIVTIKNFTEEFKSKYNRLDILINNAGVMIPPYSKTKDGFELQFGVNHLGHFVLTAHLIDVITSTENSRIVNLSSLAHRQGNLNFDDLNWEKRKFKRWSAYGDSKISNLYFTYELQKKLAAKGSSTIVTVAHPGWTATDLQRHNGFFEFLNQFFAQSVAMGALPTLRAATDESVNGGEFYGPDGLGGWRGYPVLTEPIKRAKDSETAKKLWSVSEEMTGVKYNL